jgi:hypothetical protein
MNIKEIHWQIDKYLVYQRMGNITAMLYVLEQIEDVLSE